jgi:xanthine dehydrogenase YagR molybdenum-binding subunit
MADALKTNIEVGLAGKTTVMEVEIPAGDPPPYKVGERPVTGKRRPRLDGPQMVTGRAAYTHDARRPGMLHARILRSPHAHAKIVSIDTSALEKMPGVVFENPGKDTVRYHGDAVLALAAPTRAAAEDALRAVKVVYDVLPHTVSLAAARKEGSPLVFQKAVEEKRSAGDVPGGSAPVEQKGNVRGPKTSGQGDADKGFAEAEGTLEVVTTTSVQTHVPLETHSLLAEWVGDTLEVQASTQGTFSVRDELAGVLKLPKDKVIVRAEFTGGGFGAKFGAGD